MTKWHCFSFLHICLMTSIVEESWILLSTYVFNLLLHHTSCSFWKTLLYIWEKMRVKTANYAFILFRISFDISNPPERVLRGLRKSVYHPLRTISKKHLLYIMNQNVFYVSRMVLIIYHPWKNWQNSVYGHSEEEL